MLLVVAVGGVSSKFPDSLAADVCLAGHEWLKINQSIKLNTVPGMKHILTTKISFLWPGISERYWAYIVSATQHRQALNCAFCAGKCNLKANIALLEMWSPHFETTLYYTTNR